MTTTTKLTEALDALVAAALTKHHDSTSNNLFTLCHVCNRWDEHAPTCPIPAIQHWLGDALSCASSPTIFQPPPVTFHSS